jgi:cell division protein FtsB
MAKKSRRSRLIAAFLPFVVAAFAVYTVYQLFSGERGVFSWLKLQRQVQVLQQDKHALEQRKVILGERVERLSPEAPDEDYLDEKIRRTLPHMRPNDYVIFVEEEEDKTAP